MRFGTVIQRNEETSLNILMTLEGTRIIKYFNSFSSFFSDN